MTPYLTDAEIATICEPLKLGKAQCRYLTRLGLIVKNKPNGKPLVARGEFERVMIGRQPDTQTSGGTQPNAVALLRLVGNQKGARHGTQTQ